MNERTQAEEIVRALDLQKRRRFEQGTPSIARRIERLRALHAAIESRSAEVYAALHADVGKPMFEAAMDYMAPLREIETAIAGLATWAASVPVALSGNAPDGASGHLIYEPRGCVLIFGPWNFPFALLLQPLVGAIAAGNSCILKPSELAPRTAQVSAAIVAEVFDESEVTLFQGGAEVAELLLARPFDHIFFTGSPQVGKRVMAAAALHLTSVTLELGGKCPVIIDEIKDLTRAAERIGWGKFLNAGQMCVSPDHVWITPGQRDAFAQEIIGYIKSSYPPTGGRFNAKDLASFVNQRHLDRCLHLIEDAVSRGARVLYGGGHQGRQLEPTVLVDVSLDAAIMREEIFGPILPILTYDDTRSVFATIEKSGKPLGLYIFSDDERFIQNAIARTSSGGVTVNDVIYHGAEPNLPFGGVGQSGIGAYHGHYSFTELSHRRSVYVQAGHNPHAHALRPPYPVSA